MGRIKGRDFNYYMNVAFRKLDCDQVSCGSNGTVEANCWHDSKLVTERFNNKGEFIS